MGQCYNSTVINASIEQAWETVRDFHDMGWADPVITSVDKVGDLPGSAPGARRILNHAFHETLRSVDEENHAIVYSIDDGPGPVAADAVDNYRGYLTLFPVTDAGKTFVLWTSSYESGNDAAVGEFCNPIYRGLLQALKSNLE